MAFVYAVLGGGRQGTAAAYDMAKFGDAAQVLIADLSLAVAQKAAARVNRLIGKDIAAAHQVKGVKVSPRDVLHTLLEPKLSAKPGEPDLVIVRVLAKGYKDGRSAQVQLDLIDHYDPVTGFTAMERTTGWDASIKTIMNAQRITPRGVNPAETAVAGPRYAAELRKRGFSLYEHR